MSKNLAAIALLAGSLAINGCCKDFHSAQDLRGEGESEKGELLYNGIIDKERVKLYHKGKVAGGVADLVLTLQDESVIVCSFFYYPNERVTGLLEYVYVKDYISSGFIHVLELPLKKQNELKTLCCGYMRAIAEQELDEAKKMCDEQELSIIKQRLNKIIPLLRFNEPPIKIIW